MPALQSVSVSARTMKWLRAGFTPTPPLNIWQWAREHVDFALVPNYDTPLHERYDPDFMPFWKEPAECVTDPTVYEVIALKCARAGGSENLLLNPIRYSVAVRPQPTLYVTGDQLSAERMMDRRIIRGLKASKQTRHKVNAARLTQHDAEFADMDLRVTWPKAKQAFKQDGWALVLCDEVSTWPEFSAYMARKRTASYPFAHIVFISSPDPQAKRPSDDDPIFVEYRRGDQRRWHCTDPATGEPFVFEMGKHDTPHGLKWDKSAKREDGSYDYDKVAQTAHYVTPGGSVLREADRMAIVRAGHWQPTAPAPSNVRSYHVTAFMTPFDSFAGIAVAFLKANAAGPLALRTFVYEYLAEPWYGEKQTIEVNSIEKRRGSYRMGQRLVTVPAYEYLSKRRGRVLMSVDVQKNSVWVLVREWFEGGDSALVHFQEVDSWKDVAALKAKHGVERIFIDLGYEGRRNEVLEQAMFGYIKGAVPMLGRDGLREPHDVKKEYDPFEGTGKQSRVKMTLVIFNPNQAKHTLSRLMDGTDPRQWLLPADAPAEYIRHVTAEECIDGAWIARHKDNHGLDCETMNLVAAKVSGIFSEVIVALDDQPLPVAPVRPPRIRSVNYPD